MTENNITALTEADLKESEVIEGAKIYADSEAYRYAKIREYTDEVKLKAVDLATPQTITAVKTFSAKPILEAGATLDGDMDFNENQAKGMVIENRTTDPLSPATGQIWFRTDV